MRKRNINLYKKYIIMTTKTIQNSVHAIAHDINSSTPNTLSPNTYLTPHFRLIEFTRSGEAATRTGQHTGQGRD